MRGFLCGCFLTGCLSFVSIWLRSRSARCGDQAPRVRGIHYGSGDCVVGGELVYVGRVFCEGGCTTSRTYSGAGAAGRAGAWLEASLHRRVRHLGHSKTPWRCETSRMIGRDLFRRTDDVSFSLATRAISNATRMCTSFMCSTERHVLLVHGPTAATHRAVTEDHGPIVYLGQQDELMTHVLKHLISLASAMAGA